MSPGRNRPHARPAALPPLSLFRSLRSLLSPLPIPFSSCLCLSLCSFSPLSFCPPISVTLHFLALLLECFSGLFLRFLSLSFLPGPAVPYSGPGAPSHA